MWPGWDGRDVDKYPLPSSVSNVKSVLYVPMMKLLRTWYSHGTVIAPSQHRHSTVTVPPHPPPPPPPPKKITVTAQSQHSHRHRRCSL